MKTFAAKRVVSAAIALLLAAAALWGIPSAQPALGAAAMPGGTGDDTADMLSSFDNYIATYLPGISSASRQALRDYLEDGLTNDKDRYFMPMMSTLAYLRKAGQSGEGEGVTDVVGGYASLSETARTDVVSNLKYAFESVRLTTAFADYTLTLSDGGQPLTAIVFSAPTAQTTAVPAQTTAVPAQTTAPVSTPEATAKTAQTTVPAGMNEAAESGTVSPDVTKTYFNAYLPGVPESVIDEVKTLIQAYTADGGGPAGSGALWRCIREAGVLMGREVEMAADYLSYTVVTEGTARFLDLDTAAQEAVIAKVQEGIGAIAATAVYENGIFTVTKKGEVQFTYAVDGAEPSVTTAPDTEAGETGASAAPTAGVIAAVVIAVVLLAVVLLIVWKDRWLPLLRRQAKL